MFDNLKITINLDNAICINKDSGAFDSILAMLYFNSLKNKGEFNGDYDQRLDFLDMTDGIYHTSFPVFEDVKYYQKEQLIKKFDHDMYAKYGFVTQKNGKGKEVMNTTSGKYKNWFFNYERLLMKSIVYYVRGDLKTIEQLLEGLKFLGKKTSLGWGKIKNLEIQKISKDYSIIRNGKLMRNIPVKNTLYIKSDCKALFRLTHPYWSRDKKVDCFMPC